MKKHKTADQRILKALQDGELINPLSAWDEYSVYRLSGVIHRLRKGRGHSCEGIFNIKTEMVSVLNAYSETIKVAQYSMEVAEC